MLLIAILQKFSLPNTPQPPPQADTKWGASPSVVCGTQNTVPVYCTYHIREEGGCQETGMVRVPQTIEGVGASISYHFVELNWFVKMVIKP